MKRIEELKKALKEALEDVAPGAHYSHGAHCESGGKILRGEHITVYVPEELDFNPKQVEALFNLYYTDVQWDGKVEGDVHFAAVHNGTLNRITLDVLPLPDLKKLNADRKKASRK